MRKTIVFVTLLAVVLLLAGCQEGMINSSVSITSKAGAGTKTISVDILKDTAPIPGNKNGATVGNNSKFLIGGGKALRDKLIKIVKLKGVTIKNEDKGQLERVTLTYSFSSIADYNAKMKTLADGKGDIKDAVLKVNGDSVTFTEPASNAYNSMLWAIQAVYNDKKLFDITGKGDVKNNPITIDQMAKVYDVSVSINGTSKTVNLKDMPQTKTISVTGKITGGGSTAPSKSTQPSKSSSQPAKSTQTSVANPKTSDTGSMPYILLALFSAAAILVLTKWKVKRT